MLPANNNEYEQNERDLSAEVKSDKEVFNSFAPDEPTENLEELDLSEPETNEPAESEKPKKEKKKPSKMLLALGGLGGVMLLLTGGALYLQKTQVPVKVAKPPMTDISANNSEAPVQPQLNSQVPAQPNFVPENPAGPNLNPAGPGNNVTPSAPEPFANIPNGSAAPTVPSNNVTTAPSSPLPAPVTVPPAAVVPGGASNIEIPKFDNGFKNEVKKEEPKVEEPKVEVKKEEPKIEVKKEEPKVEVKVDEQKIVKKVKPKIVKKVVKKEYPPSEYQNQSQQLQAPLQQPKHPSQESSSHKTNDSFYGYEKLF